MAKIKDSHQESQDCQKGPKKYYDQQILDPEKFRFPIILFAISRIYNPTWKG